MCCSTALEIIGASYASVYCDTVLMNIALTLSVAAAVATPQVMTLGTLVV